MKNMSLLWDKIVFLIEIPQHQEDLRAGPEIYSQNFPSSVPFDDDDLALSLVTLVSSRCPLIFSEEKESESCCRAGREKERETGRERECTRERERNKGENNTLSVPL